MDQQTIHGQFEDPTLGAYYFEGSWQMMGHAAAWHAFVWSKDGILAGSPGGVLIDARLVDVRAYVRSEIEKTIQRTGRISRNTCSGP
jgi:hypothetical protein